jgi:hypothetical protein
MMPARKGLATSGLEGRILLFLKKKKQKDFIRLRPEIPGFSGRKVRKVFWFFFSKKNRLLTPALPPSSP